MEAKKSSTTTRVTKDSSKIVESRFTASDREPAVPSSASSVYKSSAEASVRQKNQLGATASVYKSSTYAIDCKPCSAAGDDVLAVAATKDHTIMDQSKMPTISTTSESTSVASMNIKQRSDAGDTQFQDEYHFSRDINIKCQDEKNDCHVIRMAAISVNELLLIDQTNTSVKMFDIDNDVMTAVKKFDGSPNGMTLIPGREVAVTFIGERLIRILTTNGGLSVKRSFKLNGSCLAAEFCNDKLYVSYAEPVKFQILNLTGGVKKTIKPDSNFLEHCTWPYFIAVHPDESKIYVSDWRNHVVLCMDMNGTMLGVYKDAGLESPYNINFTPFGSIYLCNRDEDMIYKMAEDLSEGRVILALQDGLRSPAAMCFCPGRKSLYISSSYDDLNFRNVIKEYNYS